MGRTLRAADVASITFEPTQFRLGYDPAEVDAFLLSVESAMRSGEPLEPLLNDARFTVTRLRDGYDQAEVDEFIDELRRDQAEPASAPRPRRSAHRAQEPLLRPRPSRQDAAEQTTVPAQSVPSPPDPADREQAEREQADREQEAAPEPAVQPATQPSVERADLAPAGTDFVVAEPDPASEHPVLEEVSPAVPGVVVVIRQEPHGGLTAGGLSADDVDAVRFGTTRLFRPYDMAAVDAFLDRVSAALRAPHPGPPESVVPFPAAHRVGYRRKEVDRLVSQLTSSDG